jgi:hypothetical protein
MSYRGDISPGDVLDLKFTTRRFSTGAPHTLAGTPAVSIYKDNGTTESTAGVTLTADFDSRTGLNHLRIDTSADGTFYAAGSNFQAVITAGTVDSVSVVGEIVAEFSIHKRSALRPTTAGRTLDVSAGGEAGLDWANVGSPTTTVGLSGTTVKTATDVETDTADIQSRLPAALVSGRINAYIGSMADDVVTANAIAADAIGSSELAASAITEIQSGLSTLDAAGVRTAVGLASANLDTQLDAIPTAVENADALLNRDMATGTDSGSSTVRTVRQALRFLRNKWSISAGTLTVCKEDDSTASWTAAVTTTAGDPVSAAAPAGP